MSDWFGDAIRLKNQREALEAERQLVAEKNNAEIASLRDALRTARGVIADEHAVALGAACLLDRAGRPRRETLDPMAKAHVERLEAALAEIDAALNRGAHR